MLLPEAIGNQLTWHVACQLSSRERFLSGFLAKLNDL
jgi:hypothetical protein